MYVLLQDHLYLPTRPFIIKPVEELLDIFDLYEDIDLISYMYDYENLLRANIPLDRKSLYTQPIKRSASKLSIFLESFSH
jgi:hypothetical protein